MDLEKHETIDPHDIHGIADWVLRGAKLDGCDEPDTREVVAMLGGTISYDPPTGEPCGWYTLDPFVFYARFHSIDAEVCGTLGHELAHYGFEGAVNMGLYLHNEQLVTQVGWAIQMPRQAFERRLRLYGAIDWRLFDAYPLVPRRSVERYAKRVFGWLLPPVRDLVNASTLGRAVGPVQLERYGCIGRRAVFAPPRRAGQPGCVANACVGLWAHDVTRKGAFVG